MKRRIIFRADAGQNIGYGHFIRSSALADMLKDDFDVLFATINPTDYQKNELSNICSCINLNQATHCEDFLSILQGDEIVVLDNYFFTTDYQRAVRAKGCKLVCIDDMHDKHYVADVVICHELDDASLFSVEPYTRLCLGIEWALLRKPFFEAGRNRRHSAQSEVNNIVVAFGGIDEFHLTDKVITMLLTNEKIKRIDAILGETYKEKKGEIYGIPVKFHRSISAQKVANLFSVCDLAILSASIVCLEALACGAKVAAGYYVDNQYESYNNFKNKHFIYGLGALLELKSLNIEAMSFSNIRTPKIQNVISAYIQCFKSLQGNKN
jgi:spore coat polysaccharide biosynthesis predicted glycosyltransferase SpsG